MHLKYLSYLYNHVIRSILTVPFPTYMQKQLYGFDVLEVWFEIILWVLSLNIVCRTVLKFLRVTNYKLHVTCMVRGKPGSHKLFLMRFSRRFQLGFQSHLGRNRMLKWKRVCSYVLYMLPPLTQAAHFRDL